MHLDAMWSARPLATRTVAVTAGTTYTVNFDIVGYSNVSGYSQNVRCRILIPGGGTVTQNFTATGAITPFTFTPVSTGNVTVEISLVVSPLTGSYTPLPYIDIDNFSVTYITTTTSSVLACTPLEVYRYGFNGEEKMNEISSEAMVYDLGERYFDNRTGKMYSLDPLMANYPWQSPYAYCNNNFIAIIDIKGEGGSPSIMGAFTWFGNGLKQIMSGIPFGGVSTVFQPGIVVNFGSANTKVSAGFNFVVNASNITAAYGACYSLYNNFNGTRKKGGELISSFQGGFDNGTYSLTFGTNLFTGSGQLAEFNQRTGIMNIKIDKFTMSYENDGYFFAWKDKNGKNRRPLADGMDRYRTAAVRIGWGDNFTAGFNLFTGSRTNYDGDDDKVGHMKEGNFCERYPNGYVNENGSKYRLGVLYFGYKDNLFGINSDRWIRHPIQDHFAHNFSGGKQPGFTSESNKISPFYQVAPIPPLLNYLYQSRNPAQNPIKKFTTWN